MLSQPPFMLAQCKFNVHFLIANKSVLGPMCPTTKEKSIAQWPILQDLGLEKWWEKNLPLNSDIVIISLKGRGIIACRMTRFPMFQCLQIHAVLL